MSSAKRFLFLVRHPPLAGFRARETLDMILTCAAFDQFVRVLFLDDGVFQLIAAPSDDQATQPDALAMLKTLDFYDIHEILVEADSLHARGLSTADLAMATKLIARDRVKGLLAEHDRVVVC